MESGYKCAECKEFIEKGSVVYVFQDLDERYYPFCSMSCVDKFKKKEIEQLNDKIKKIENRQAEKGNLVDKNNAPQN